MEPNIEMNKTSRIIMMVVYPLKAVERYTILFRVPDLL
jgi:hypothetical protein